MLRRIRHHRRRLVLGFVLFAVLGLTTDLGLTSGGIQTAFLLAAAMTLFFALVIAVRPRSAMIVELFGLTLLLHQGFFALSPFLDKMVSQSIPIIRLGILLMLYYLLFNISTGANGFRWPWTLGLRTRRTVAAGRDTIWRRMTPMPGRAHWDPDIAAVADTDDGLRFEAAENARLVTDGSVENVLQTEEGRFRLSHRTPPEKGIALTERLTLTHRRRGTQIELARTYAGLPMMTALNLWLSGHPGELLDRIAADLGDGVEDTPDEAPQPGVPTSPTIS